MSYRLGSKMSSVYLLVLLLSISSARSASPDYAKMIDNEFVRERMTLLQPERILRKFFENEGNEKLNEECARDLRIFEESLKLRRAWALRMLDASSTVSSGLLKGNLIDLGMYDECVNLHELESAGIRAHHCMYSIAHGLSQFEFPIYPSFSICLPTSCDEADIVSLVDEMLWSNQTDIYNNLKVKTSSCTSAEPRIKDTSFWISLAFLFIFVGFLTLCTVCDLLNRRSGVDSGTLSRFSLLKSGEKILSTGTHEDEIRALHGIRVLSIAWVVLVHEYFVSLFVANVNTIELNFWFASWISLLPLMGIYCVDTFFVLSGFLMTYTFFKKRQKNESFNVLYHYIHRYLRLILPIAALVASNFLLLVYPLSGPLYKWIESLMMTGCRTKWWSFITYTQNFVEPTNRCFQHLWFMAVDMQLYLISPLILCPLYKKPKIGLTILALFIFASIASTSVLIGVNRYPAIYFDHTANIQRTLKIFDEIYQMPYTRASPWLIGIALGYKITHGQEKPTKIGIFAGWLLMILAFAFCYFGTRSFTSLDYEYNLTWEVVFAAISRPLWGLAICWLIYACYHGYGGPISAFLSWKGFVPLSKLCYCIYLVHLLFPILRIATSRTKAYYSDYIIIHNYIGDMVLAIVLAFGTSMAFEIPMQVMDSLILQRKNRITSDLRKKDA